MHLFTAMVGFVVGLLVGVAFNEKIEVWAVSLWERFKARHAKEEPKDG